MEVAQLCLDFERGRISKPEVPANDQAKLFKDPGQDSLDTLLAAEGAKSGDIIEALIGELEKTEAGKATLAEIGARHAELLIPAELRDELVEALESAALRQDALAKRLKVLHTVPARRAG